MLAVAGRLARAEWGVGSAEFYKQSIVKSHYC